MSCFKKILVVGFEFDEERTLLWLKERLREVFHIDVELAGDLPLVALYDAGRGQYLASSFFEELVGLRKAGQIVLGVTKEDIYEPGLNFVFGVASPMYAVAIISTKRLHNSFYGLAENEDLYLRRVATEAVHEIGHTLGLGHCPDPHCVMHFSNTLADTDIKGYHFCPNCWRKASRRLCLGD